MNWSDCRDSPLALYHILKDKNYSIKKLLTSINNEFWHISMHGVREELAEKRANAIGIPLQH